MSDVIRRMEVFKEASGRFRWRTINDQSGEVLCISKRDYVNSRNAGKIASREVGLYASGVAVLVFIDE